MSDLSTCTLITGASSGIGRALALRLAPTRRLILHGRDAEKLAALHRDCASTARHIPWNFDLRNVDELEDSMAALLAARGVNVNAFVHCAGVAPLQPMRLVKLPALEDLMRVNFTSAALLASVLLRKKPNAGALRSMVFISSIASRFGVNGFNLYGASKGALDALVKSLAVELAPLVRVNSVLPGGLPPPPDRAAVDEIIGQLKSRVPLGLGTPDDVAATVEFLLSDNARWITGQQIVVDGGFTSDATL